MTKPTIHDVNIAARELERARKEGTRWELRLARKWYKIVKEASVGFDGLAAYVPLRERGVALAEVYEHFVAEMEVERERRGRLLRHPIRRERLDG